MAELAKHRGSGAGGIGVRPHIYRPSDTPPLPSRSHFGLHGGSNSTRAAMAERPDDGPERLRLQARAADQSPVDVLDRHDLSCVAGIHGTSVQKAQRRRLRTKPLYEQAPHHAVNVANFLQRWRPTGPNCPYGFVGDDRIRCVGTVRNRVTELVFDRSKRLSCTSLRFRFTDAYDGNQAGTVCRGSLLAYDGIRFPVVGPSLRMTDDHVGATGVLEHSGADVARVGTARSRVTILAAQCDLRAGDDVENREKQMRWRAHDDVAGQPVLRPRKINQRTR